MSLWLIIILVLAVVALIIGVVLASGGGPRVTTIEHKVERDSPGEDA